MENYVIAAAVIGFLFAVARCFYILPLELFRSYRRRIDEAIAQRRNQEQRALRHARAQQSQAQRDARSKVSQKRQAIMQAKRRASLAQRLQIAFSQIGNDPDAKRLRSWAIQAKELPQEFRRRQYGRFKSHLIRRLHEWDASGTDRGELRQDLQDIAEAMGVAKFEADYLVDQLPPPPTPRALSGPEEFDQRLREIHREHQSRMSSLRSANLDPELLEELIETEQNRYRDQLLGNRGSH